MTDAEPVGYLASGLVLATFCARDMTSLRLLALTSNLTFIVYAALAGLHPILLLHVLLVPLNALRLIETLRRRGTTPRPPPLQGESP